MKKNESAMDPIALFFKWYEEARTGKGGLFPKNRIIVKGTQVIRRLIEAVLPWSNVLRPDIATLATTTPDNKPAARSILFKGFVDDGFSFYTDYASDKGKELDLNPSAVMVFYWHFPPRQVRIDGKVLKLSRKAAETDWQARRRANQAAAAAVTQSSVIQAREELIANVDHIKQQYKGKPIPCPDTWGGYRLIPDRMEFWEGRPNWIHRRERYVLNKGAWQRLYITP